MKGRSVMIFTSFSECHRFSDKSTKVQPDYLEVYSRQMATSPEKWLKPETWNPDSMISRFGIVFLFSNIACVSKGKTVTISHTLERNRWGS